MPRVVAFSAQSPKPHAVVIGGGIGGIATAARLAKVGRFNVTLLEKNSIVGGRCQSEYIHGYRFDTGPSLLLFPDKYKETFDYLNHPMPQIERIEPAAYRVFYASSSSPDVSSLSSTSIDLLANTDAMVQQLERMEPGAGKGYLEFLKMAKSHLELGVPHFIEKDFTELQDAKSLLDLVPSIQSINPWQLLGPHDRVLKSFFKKDPKIRSAFTFQDLYVGLSPFTAPAVFSLLAGTELVDGVFYPLGGFQKIRDALKDAAEECGVDIQTNTEVIGIEVKDSRAKAVHTKTGKRIDADVVVCNRDLPAAYKLLYDNNCPEIVEYAQRRESQLSALKYSVGIISFNWCIDNTSGALNTDRLAHHSVFLSVEYSKAWKPAVTADDYVQFPNFYVHTPSMTDPSAAPDKNCLSMMVLLPVANMQQRDDNSDYTELIQIGKERVLRTLRDAGIGDVAPCIQHEMVLSPPDWKERYGLMHGAAFGLSHSLDQLSLFRPGIKEKKVQGMYFVGASTRPGNGVPLCLISARLTAERVLKDYSYSLA